jgi:hypothetical protein
MDRRTKSHFKRGVTLILLSFVLLSVYSVVKYRSVDAFTLTMILAGISVGIFISYLSYISFFEREHEMAFLPNETVLLKRTVPEKSVIIPQMLNGKSTSDAPPEEVNLYLTSIGIAAEKPGAGEPILYIPYRDVQEMQTLNRMLLKYIRIRYVDATGMASEILLYVGKDIDAWAENIGRMLVGQI